MTAWIIRAGRYGEREQWALESGLSGADFHEVGDLTPANTKDKVRTAISAAFPSAPPGRQANFSGQLWALRDSVKPGDLIVMPLKTTKKIALGIVTSGYSYRPEAPEDRRHTIAVDWKTSDVSRAGHQGRPAQHHQRRDDDLPSLETQRRGAASQGHGNRCGPRQHRHVHTKKPGIRQHE